MNKHTAFDSISVLAIDLGKSSFHLCAQNTQGKILKQQKLTASVLKRTLAQCPPCRVVMEACAGAHYWARYAQQLDHDARLISPQFVKPFVKSNKNDQADAHAIAEAAVRPAMRFVSIKSEDQLSLQALHRARQLVVGQRTAQANQIRGFLLEFGVTLPKGVTHFRRGIPQVLDAEQCLLPPSMRALITQLWHQWLMRDQEVQSLQDQLERLAREQSACQRLMSIPGVGPLTATALVAHVGDPSTFRDGRELAAYLGLVPRQKSTGGRETLLGISKRGDRHLRTLLIHGARAALRAAAGKSDRLSRWARLLADRRGVNIAAVALANKNARIAWCLLRREQKYQVQSV